MMNGDAIAIKLSIIFPLCFLSFLALVRLALLASGREPTHPADRSPLFCGEFIGSRFAAQLAVFRLIPAKHR